MEGKNLQSYVMGVWFDTDAWFSGEMDAVTGEVIDCYTCPIATQEEAQRDLDSFIADMIERNESEPEYDHPVYTRLDDGRWQIWETVK